MPGHKNHSISICYANIFCTLFLTFLCLFLFSCRKLVQVEAPNNTVNSGNVFENDATAIAAVTDIYATLSRSNLIGGGVTSLSLFPGLSSDELSLYSGAINNSVLYFYRNALSSNNLNNPDFWASLYKTIYISNSCIEGLSNSNTLNILVKQQLTGEAKFIRAFCYFYLINLYGDVPLVLNTDYTLNSTLKRTSMDEVYNQVIDDLKDAQYLLSSQYLNASLLSSTLDRVRPTKWAATALLSRVYLFTSDFSNAEIQATDLINNISLFDTVSLNNVFLKNSKESIWQLQPVHTGWNTEAARLFILPSSGANSNANPVYLSPHLLSSFSPEDKRLTKWINSVSANGNVYYYPFKYKSATFGDSLIEYEMVFRIAEQYLVRAESRAQNNKFQGAKDDLNIIRRRAGLGVIDTDDKKSLMAAIARERQVELFTEWGHRWFDLKRSGNIDAVMSIVTPQKGGSWNRNWQWYPISINELLRNPNLDQNDGY